MGEKERLNMDRNTILLSRALATGVNGKFTVDRGLTATINLSDVHKVPEVNNTSKPEYMVGKKYTDSRDLVKIFDLCKAVSPQPISVTVKRSEDGKGYEVIDVEVPEEE